MGVWPFCQMAKVMWVRLKFYLLHCSFRVPFEIIKSCLPLCSSFSNCFQLFLFLCISIYIFAKKKLSKPMENLIGIKTNLYRSGKNCHFEQSKFWNPLTMKWFPFIQVFNFSNVLLFSVFKSCIAVITYIHYWIVYWQETEIKLILAYWSCILKSIWSHFLFLSVS